MKIFRSRQILLFLLVLCSVSQAQPASYQSEVLAAHNKYRALHHAPALEWDDELAYYAEKYANQCEFKHSSSPYGENLATGYPSISAAVKIWYDESARYSYDDPGYSTATGHFSQVVWKNTRKVGCGYVACNGKNGTPGKFLVCEYSPHGNVLSKKLFEENVLPE
jgi:uncharacterized protein YkwD